jgi:hypothetical protein
MIFAVQRSTSVKMLIAILVAGFGLVFAPVSNRALATGNSVLVYQVQTGAPASSSQEFISLYNITPEPIDITGWCMVYSSASDATQSQLSCLTPPNGQTKFWLDGHRSLLMASSEFIQANPDISIDLTFKSGIAATSGHVKLLNSHKEVVDLVGWGTATKPEGTATIAHVAGKALQRLNIDDLKLQDTDNNAADFYQTNLVAPLTGLYEEYIEQSSEINGLQITEILPDAVGADAGKEFIEIYNPNSGPVSLENYILQLGPGYSKSYSLPDIIIEPLNFMALYDDKTKISLPNTSGSVRLLDYHGNILSTTDSYQNPGEGLALALSDEAWQLTYQPTPGSKNVILSSKPCPAGQVRSPDSGRCRKTLSVVANSLKSCKPGQIRSLETNRCRSITSKIGTKAACKSDQFRNPETGRCKKAASSTGPKPCPAGQQRNKETNRCRKIQPAVSKNEIKDIESPLVTSNFKWWLAGASAVGSVGYGAYEWRREVWQALSAIKMKFMG